MTAAKAPAVYLPHGGGPMPLMQDPAHQQLIAFLQQLPARFSRPEAILLISAHWEEALPTLNAAASPAMLFDYYGFPPETYKFTYPAPGSPSLCQEIARQVSGFGIAVAQEQQRGFDHGVFVPLLLMYPQADIPVVQLSLIKGLDADRHIELGRALAALREQNVLILGSGMSFHNLQALFAGERADLKQASDQFADWLKASLCSDKEGREDRLKNLADWQDAPYATFCHPRAEHLLPLHVCLGAAQGERAECIFDAALMGHRVLSFIWQ